MPIQKNIVIHNDGRDEKWKKYAGAFHLMSFFFAFKTLNKLPAGYLILNKDRRVDFNGPAQPSHNISELI